MIKGENSESIMVRLYETFTDCGDFNLREILCMGKRVYLANIGNFSGRTYISEAIVKPLVMTTAEILDDEALSGIICASETGKIPTYEEICQRLLAGCGVVFTDIPEGVSVYYAVARNDPGRSVGEPDNEVVVRGPREGFIEKAEDNVALIRKRLRTEKMKVINVSVGKQSDTSVKVVYLKDVADDRLVSDILTRLSKMKLDTVMDSGYIEQFLIPGASKILTEIGNSEKPDKVAAKIAEGRIAIICDGSPIVLTVPYLFTESLQSAEDYLKTSYYATFIRCIRFISMLISLYLPAFYIAVMEYHKNAIPFSLYRSMTDARRDVPFGVFAELVVILLIFELIREVGVRMPGAVGDAVGIVAGLILGDAAISAGISSAPVIMVASLTAITTFILPPYMNSTVLIRLVNLIIARLFGVVGIALSITALIIYLCSKTSFGVPYMYPFVPTGINGLNDTVFVRPKKAVKKADK